VHLWRTGGRGEGDILDLGDITASESPKNMLTQTLYACAKYQALNVQQRTVVHFAEPLRESVKPVWFTGVIGLVGVARRGSGFEKLGFGEGKR